MNTPVGYHDLVYTGQSLYLIRNSMDTRDYLCCVIEDFKRSKAAVATTQEC